MLQATSDDVMQKLRDMRERASKHVCETLPLELAFSKKGYTCIAAKRWLEENGCGFMACDGKGFIADKDAIRLHPSMTGRFDGNDIGYGS